MATCSDGDSFYLEVDFTWDGLDTFDGCYSDSGLTREDIIVYFRDRFEVDGEPAVRVTDNYGSPVIWVLTIFDEGDQMYYHRCRDADGNDATLIHPTEVTQWDCEDDLRDYTRLDAARTSCGCPSTTTTAPAAFEPTPAPTTLASSTPTPLTPTPEPVASLSPSTPLHSAPFAATPGPISLEPTPVTTLTPAPVQGLPTPAPTAGGENGLSAGAIGGVVAGGLLILLGAIGGGVACTIKNSNNNNANNTNNNQCCNLSFCEGRG